MLKVKNSLVLNSKLPNKGPMLHSLGQVLNKSIKSIKESYLSEALAQLCGMLCYTKLEWNYNSKFRLEIKDWVPQNCTSRLCMEYMLQILDL